jgi:glycosyltransferase involved in cell wall biosynthesis
VRILVVTNLLPPVVHGGYERECAAVVAHLRARHDVTVLTSAQGAGTVPAEPGVLRVLPLARGGAAASVRAPADALRGVRLARRVLADVAPELVYVWNGAGLPYAALQVLHDAGRPLAHRVCEGWFAGLYGEDRFMRDLTPGETAPAHPLRRAWAHGMRLVDRLPALRTGAPRPPRPTSVSYASAFLRDAVGVPPPLRAVHVEVLLPATPQTDAMATVPRRPAARPTVLFVGRLEPQKGAQVALRALARLPGVALTVVGPGDAAPLRALAGQLGVADRVRFTGPLAGAALHEEVAAAHAWVVPSVWEEPAGLVCVEAGLARVPLVASRIGGIGELLRDEVEARLFAAGDDGACAAALVEALAGGPVVAARVERALQRARALGHGAYLAATDRFLDVALALGR